MRLFWAVGARLPGRKRGKVGDFPLIRKRLLACLLGLVTFCLAGFAPRESLCQSVVAWGDNFAGETNVPTGLSNVRAVAAGAYHCLALRANGTVLVWGAANLSVDYGQYLVPASLTNATAIAAGYCHSLALTSNGTVVAWGAFPTYYGNTCDYGQVTVPVGLSNVAAIAAGGYLSMALKSDGKVVAWGDNSYGQTNVPTGLSNVVAIAAGQYHCLALRSNGTVVAWGSNGSGQSAVPDGLSNVVAITAGYYYSLALKSDGTLIVWGGGGLGATNVPAGLNGIVAVSGGDSHGLALQGDGTVVAWGSGVPTNVPFGLSNVKAISAGNNFSLALTAVPYSCPLPQILDITSSQNSQPNGVQVIYCADVSAAPGDNLAYNWSNVIGSPLSSFQAGNCFYVTYNATNTDVNQVHVDVTGRCGTTPGNSGPTATCAICVSRGAPSLLSGTAGSGLGPTLNTTNCLRTSNCGMVSSTAKWFKMIATNETGLVTIGTEGSLNQPLLAIYSGPLTNLSAVCCDASTSTHAGRVTFNAVKAVVYWIVVDAHTNNPTLRLATGFEPSLAINRSLILTSTIAPAVTYQLQAATSPAVSASNWVTLLTTNSSSNYQIYFRDSAPGFKQRFFRLAAPSP
jgi:alpha-tubulin suppressor-like RCC1 family protein